MTASYPTTLKLTPLKEVTKKEGARLIERDGWLVAEAYTDLESEVAAASQGLAIADTGANGKIWIEGQHTEHLIREVFHKEMPTIGNGVTAGTAGLYRLRRDMFFVTTTPMATAAIVEALARRIDTVQSFVTITDMTHGHGEICILGPCARLLLSKVCALDLGHQRSDGCQAWQTSVARTGQLLIHEQVCGSSSFSLVGPRSYCEYLWGVLLAAGREWNIQPIGTDALKAIEQN